MSPVLQDNSTALSIAMEAGHREIGVLLYAHLNFKQGSPVSRPPPPPLAAGGVRRFWLALAHDDKPPDYRMSRAG